MSISLKHNYNQKLRDARPITLKHHTPKGALGDIQTSGGSPLILPPINTNIQFTLLPEFKISEHRGLAALNISIPTNFNWRTGAKAKGKEHLIVTPGNQMLCGSCWAIAAAGVISDNFVVSGFVDWYPNLSTTWILSCYPQHQCHGGNPAMAFQQIAQGILVSNHCIDYSWCAENELCNGKATHHFDEKKKPLDLSIYIPKSCGCYDSDSEFFAYKIAKNAKNISIGRGGITQDNMGTLIKKHILQYGPVLGGFIVFKNFMHGHFTKVNGGVYLENGDYSDVGKVTLMSEGKMTAAENYVGSHAVAIIGWGEEKGVIIDDKGTRKDIPYWYCRNSWTEKWGDGGYFKMAMYPYNKISQFDKIVVIKTPQGNVQGGGMVLIKALGTPQKKKFPAIKAMVHKSEPDQYYTQDPKGKNPNTGNDNNGNKGGGDDHKKKIIHNILFVIGVVIGIILLILTIWIRKIIYFVFLMVILAILLFLIK